jgi:peptidoglycan/LPS O-acetylase OafA/YrhL
MGVAPQFGRINLPRLLTLQVTRGLAANLVVLAHLYQVQTTYVPGGILPQFAQYGGAGVDLFFVISGFIMVAVAGRKIGAVQFLWNRAARIYAIYWLVSAALLAVIMTMPAVVRSTSLPHSLVRSFLLVSDTTNPLLSVAWTLIFEVYFYLVFSVFLAARTPVIAGLIAWALCLAAIRFFLPDQVVASPILAMMTSALTAEFMMGAVIGVCWLKGRMPAPFIAAAAGVGGLAVSLGYAAPQLAPYLVGNFNEYRVIVFGVPCALLLYALTAYDHENAPKPARLFVALGDWSYSTYLIHVIMLSAVGRLVAFVFPAGGVVASLGLIALAFITVNLAAAACYTIVERPTLKALHRLGATLLKTPETTPTSEHSKSRSI